MLETLLLGSMKSSPALYQRMLVERNASWVPQVETCFTAKTSCFVVVGAAHLIGPDSLIAMLQKKGFLRRDPSRPRAVDVRMPGEVATAVERVEDEAAERAARPAPAYVPVIGRIAAGGPVLAEQAVGDVFPLPRELVGSGTLVSVHGVTLGAVICRRHVSPHG